MENNTPIAYKVTLSNVAIGDGKDCVREYLVKEDYSWFRDEYYEAHIELWAEDGLRISRFNNCYDLIDTTYSDVDYLEAVNAIKLFVKDSTVAKVGHWVEGVSKMLVGGSFRDVEFRVEVVERPNIDIKETIEASELSARALVEVFFNGKAGVEDGETVRVDSRTMVHTYSPLCPMWDFVVKHIKAAYKEDFLSICFNANIREDPEDFLDVTLETKTAECAKAILKDVFNVNPDLVVPEWTRGKDGEPTECRTMITFGSILSC